MAGTRAAIRYAKAVLDLAKDQNTVEIVNNDMMLIANSVAKSKDLSNMLQSPLPLVLSPGGVLICLPLVLLVTALSCYFPARSTANLSVRATLLYE